MIIHIHRVVAALVVATCSISVSLAREGYVDSGIACWPTNALTWDAAERAARYELLVGGSVCATTTATTLRVDAIPGCRGSVSVRACNDAGCGPTSEPVDVIQCACIDGCGCSPFCGPRADNRCSCPARETACWEGAPIVGLHGACP